MWAGFKGERSGGYLRGWFAAFALVASVHLDYRGSYALKVLVFSWALPGGLSWREVSVTP
jgi:hypothetical protein